MADRSGSFLAASKTLNHELDALERMVQVFAGILGMDIAARAKLVQAQLIKTAELYYEETWDSAEALTASLDLTFSALDLETNEFVKSVTLLDESISKLHRIHDQFVLPQLIVLLVGSLEVYLSMLFESLLSERLGVQQRAISKIASRYNFQNWGSSVDAFQTFLELELCPEDVDSSAIIALQQDRHVLVHRMGIVDERAARQLKLDASFIGKRLVVRRSTVLEGVRLARKVDEYLCEQILGDASILA